MARTHVQQRFGKTEGISEADVLAFLAVKPRESSTLEAKGLGKVPDFYTQREDLLVGPVVQFLNKPAGDGGLLVLGVDGPNHELVTLSTAAPGLLSDVQLRNWLIDGVKAIPSGHAPSLEVIPVPVAGRNPVFLVECHPAPRPTTYYSAATNAVYIRHMDSRRVLTLPEALQTIEQRSCALPYIAVWDLKTTEQGLLLYLHWVNEGNRPGRNVLAVIDVRLQSGQGITCNMQAEAKPLSGQRHHTSLGTFQLQTAGPMQLPLYPNLPVNLGGLHVNGSGAFLVRLEVAINEERGRTSQAIELERDDRGSLSVRPLEGKSYSPY